MRLPYAPAIAWGIFICVLSIWPGKDFPTIPDWGDLLSLDKMVHMTFYGLLTWLILWGKMKSMQLQNPHKLITEGGIPLLFALIVTVCTNALGWFLEWFQGAYCQDRTSDVMDGAANTIGAVLGLVVFLFYQKKKLAQKNA